MPFPVIKPDSNFASKCPFKYSKLQPVNSKVDLLLVACLHLIAEFNLLLNVFDNFSNYNFIKYNLSFKFKLACCNALFFYLYLLYSEFMFLILFIQDLANYFLLLQIFMSFLQYIGITDKFNVVFFFHYCINQ